MSPPLRRLALTLSLPLTFAAPALATPYHEEQWQPPAAIALFSGTNFTGEVREAFDPFASMHDLAFNDRARSVAVLAGQWELCEHHNFTGRCVFIREDVADLGWFGLNNHVSSIRPIFEYTEAQHGLMFTRDDYGYIRYAHDVSYGHGSWNYGYASSVRISVQHYGYSPDYWRFGYYDPRWGYDPYGFAWSPFGGPRYVSYIYRVHPRPIVINNYWRTNWRSSHPKWHRRAHREDWRRSVDWRPSGRDDRGRRDDSRRGSDYAGRGGSSSSGRSYGRGGNWTDSRSDGRREDGRSWSGGNRQADGNRSPGTRREGVPQDPRRGQGRTAENWSQRSGQGDTLAGARRSRGDGTRPNAPRTEQGARTGSGQQSGRQGQPQQRPQQRPQENRASGFQPAVLTPQPSVGQPSLGQPSTRQPSANPGGDSRRRQAPSGQVRTPRPGGDGLTGGGRGGSRPEGSAGRSGSSDSGWRGNPNQGGGSAAPTRQSASQAQPTSRPQQQARPQQQQAAPRAPQQQPRSQPQSRPQQSAAPSQRSAPPRAEGGRRGGFEGGGRGEGRGRSRD